MKAPSELITVHGDLLQEYLISVPMKPFATVGNKNSKISAEKLNGYNSKYASKKLTSNK